ncbi:MAG: lipase family protein [Acidobacteriaceae bacterium]|nr:lipase family protein [Acidobacteriaceae bacterium]
MLPDTDFLINTIYPAATAAYLVMNVPTPPLSLPSGFQMVGLLKADPQSAAHAMALAHPDQQRIANVVVAESSIFGLVLYNQAASTALIAIRGTKTVWDWIEDMDAVPVSYLADSSAGQVHMGFQLVYEHICRSATDLLENGCKGAQRILVTGHSLGAAVAVLCGFDIVHRMKLGVIPELHTFAGPRVAAPDFANNFKAAIKTCERVVNFMDVVPQVPVPPLYEQVGQEVAVKGGFKPLDVTYAHHLTTYLSGLQKLIQPAPGPAAPAAQGVQPAVGP